MPAWHAAHMIFDHFVCVLVCFFTSSIQHLPLTSIVSSFPFLQCRWCFPHSPLSYIIIDNNTTLIVFCCGVPQSHFRTTAFLLFTNHSKHNPMLSACKFLPNDTQIYIPILPGETDYGLRIYNCWTTVAELFPPKQRHKKGSPKSIQPDNQIQPWGGLMAGLLFQVSH